MNKFSKRNINKFTKRLIKCFFKDYQAPIWDLKIGGIHNATDEDDCNEVYLKLSLCEHSCQITHYWYDEFNIDVNVGIALEKIDGYFPQ